jgi:hypothetical protein
MVSGYWLAITTHFKLLDSALRNKFSKYKKFTRKKKQKFVLLPSIILSWTGSLVVSSYDFHCQCRNGLGFNDVQSQHPPTQWTLRSHR